MVKRSKLYLFPFRFWYFEPLFATCGHKDHIGHADPKLPSSCWYLPHLSPSTHQAQNWYHTALILARQYGDSSLIIGNFTANSRWKGRGLPYPHRLSDRSQNLQKFKFGNYQSPHKIWEHFIEKWRSYSSVGCGYVIVGHPVFRRSEIMFNILSSIRHIFLL